jgi:serine/threonine protein kinase
MEKYRIIGQKLGDGTFGNVVKAVNVETSELVAIKIMKNKYSNWDECLNLREIKVLRKI